MTSSKKHERRTMEFKETDIYANVRLRPMEKFKMSQYRQANYEPKLSAECLFWRRVLKEIARTF